MSRIQILDCTLRDGGYVNNFHFGKSGITKIISQLTLAGIDIVECGFLEDGEYDENTSIFNTVEQIADVLPRERRNTMYVAMACYGEYNLNQLSTFDGKSIDGIRVTFHYNEVDQALEYCKSIIDKGYKVFVQPVGTSSYSDSQLLDLISKVNNLRPFSFYLVDTLGLMLKDDILRFYYLINNNLDKSIRFGFHSHNNLQLSYSNSQLLSELSGERIISLDASVNGMGRGAGNLNTELIAYYLNSKERRYEVEPILEIVDEYITRIKSEFNWGYDVPHYLAAINGCHPNYAAFLMSKQTLTVKNIGTILRMIPMEKRSLFDKKFAEEKYMQFQEREIDDTIALRELKDKLSSKNVLVLAPGPSINNNIELIKKIAKENNCVVISVSFVPNEFHVDYTFLSNAKRYNTTFNPLNKPIKLIHTSNLCIAKENTLVVNYSSLVNEDDVIMDNSAVMLLKLLNKLSPNKVFLAGLDGYEVNSVNYYQDRLTFKHDAKRVIQLNQAISKYILDLQKDLFIEFVTPSKYIL